MAVAVAVLLLVASLGWCLLPALLPVDGTPGAGDPWRRDLEAERARALSAIRDVDLDLAMGKIGEGDHGEIRRTLEEQALTVMARLDAERRPPDDGHGRQSRG